ncbi:HpcH/HpaI aldolase family protein [Nocardia flavorosea]|uniref:2-dehydro-3-deoxyglucarate aldolase n=1 Tax=Nocardia flavorosea TaxID=53429 RepID=A0A846YNN3_9NOCA|nr:aldolase/citrate lyase family protein [Nocardia flavorosea]NKY60705.1 2-dehydro-3-deoxyglucarate aldolase [Nocardia flavorosea]
MAGMKQRLAEGEQLLGALVRMPAEELVEMVGVAGFDYVLIDCEHGPADLIPLRQHIAAAQVHGMDVLVRVGQNEPALIQRVLDHGAGGVVVPHVDDAGGAAAAVHAARYPPVGDRGFATYGRAGRYGTRAAADHLAADARETLVVAMVESAVGCRNARDIVATPGIDAVMAGPADLAVSLEVAGPADPVVVAAVADVHRAAAEHGRTRLEIVSDAPRARAAFDAGAGLVVVNLSHVLMETFAGLRAVR